MKLNSAKEDECTAYGSDYNYNDSRKDNLDSTSCNNIAVQQQIYKSCDTIDHESGLNYGEYYSLHSILSFADQNSSVVNAKSNEYSLHATKNSHLFSEQLASFFKAGKHNKNSMIKSRYFNRKHLCKIITDFAANDDSIPDMLFEYLKDFVMIQSYLSSISAKTKVQLENANYILLYNIDKFFINDFKSFNFNMAYKTYCECKMQAQTDCSKANLAILILESNLKQFKLA